MAGESIHRVSLESCPSLSIDNDCSFHPSVKQNLWAAYWLSNWPTTSQMALQTLTSRRLRWDDACDDSDEAQLEHSPADGCHLGVSICNNHIQSNCICMVPTCVLVIVYTINEYRQLTGQSIDNGKHKRMSTWNMKTVLLFSSPLSHLQLAPESNASKVYISRSVTSKC